MLVKVLKLDNTGENFEIDYATTTVGDLAAQVMIKYAIDPEVYTGVRLIHKGTVMDHAEKLSTYIPDAVGTQIISLPQKKPGKPPASIPPPPVPAPAVVTPPAVAYSVDQVHATLLVLLQFIRSHPVLSFMFMQNMSQLQTMLLDSGFKDVVRQILTQSNALIAGMASGSAVPIQIQGFDLGQSTTVPSSLVGPTGTSTQTAVPDAEAEAEAESEAAFSLGAIMQNVMGALGTGGGGGGVDLSAIASPPLTAEDNANIAQLVGLGFPEHRAKAAYLQCGKNLDVAASLLFEQSGLN